MAHTPAPNASETAKAIQTVLQKYDDQRNLTVAERAALVTRLEAARTEVERKEVLDRLEREQAAREDERRETARQIRDDVRRVRNRSESGS